MNHNITLSFSIEEMKEYLTDRHYSYKTIHGYKHRENHNTFQFVKFNTTMVIYYKEEVDIKNKDLDIYSHLTLENQFTKELKAKLLTL